VETLDIEQPTQLLDWLRTTGRIGPVENPSVRVLAGGVSNRTVRVDRVRGEAWVLKQALPRLRVAVEWFSAPERAHREALGMRWLVPLAPPGAIPPLLFEDEGHHVVAMRAVPEPHANWKALLLAGDVRADHVRQFGQLLGCIHRRSLLAAPRLRDLFADRTYFEGLRLEPFYLYTAGELPDAARFLGALAAETRDSRRCLVHGDYSPKNILIHRGHLILLDHEVIHWGDPAFDVGFALAHLLSKAHRLQACREALAGAALLFWEHYQFAACDCLVTPEHQARAARHALGCLLARAAGRSQVEYLDADAKARQRSAALALVHQPPASVLGLVERFLAAIGQREA
jgi:aminoglycoside phosphotransferase (APT) family kinase protein